MSKRKGKSYTCAVRGIYSTVKLKEQMQSAGAFVVFVFLSKEISNPGATPLEFPADEYFVRQVLRAAQRSTAISQTGDVSFYLLQ